MKIDMLIVFLFLNICAIAQIGNVTISLDEQQIIVNEHNKYREEVGAEQLIWSENLAVEAQFWADSLAKNCRMKLKDTIFGENICMNMAEISVVEIISFWASEKKYYSGEIISAYNFRTFGHYTQIVWYNTTEIGCAKSFCKEKGEILVCFYYPSGNYIGEKAYGN